MLVIDEISFAYGFKPVLNSVYMTLEFGKVYGLVGANGSGKTTLLNLLSGFLEPSKGDIILNGSSICSMPPFLRQRSGIGRTFQDLRSAPDLSVEENIVACMKDLHASDWSNSWLPERREVKKDLEKSTGEIVDKFGLAEVSANMAGEISYGQQKLLTLACCHVGSPSVFLLDEPVAGVNDRLKPVIQRLIKEVCAQNKLVLVIEHDSEFLSKICDSVFFLREGKVKQYPSYHALRASEEVKEAYV